MYYSYKNIPITLAAQAISGFSGFSGYTGPAQYIVNNCNITYSPTIDPIQNNLERYSFSYAPANGINGELAISYFLTGNDNLLNYTIWDGSGISGNIGGLFFTGGHLKSYSIDFTPNTPLIANANIVFYDRLYGQFTAPSPSLVTGNILNASNVTITTAMSAEIINDISAYNWNYNVDLQPLYKVSVTGLAQNIVPDRVIYGKKTINASVTCDSIDPTLPITGRFAYIRVNLGHPTLGVLTNFFEASGTLSTKNLQVGVKDKLKTIISIQQENVGTHPIIYGVTIT